MRLLVGKLIKEKKEFRLEASSKFKKQVKNLNTNTKNLIIEKLELIRINPFRYKKLKHPKFNLFRIRFTDERKEKRIIYLVDKNVIMVVCIIDRNKEYKDLDKYLKVS